MQGYFILIARNMKCFPNIKFEEKPIKFFCLTYSGYNKQTVIPVKFQRKDKLCWNKHEVNYVGEGNERFKRQHPYLQQNISSMIFRTCIIV